MPIEALETTQLKYLKKTLGVSQSTPTLAVYGETGRFPLQLRQEDSMILLWARIQRLPHTNFLRKIYKYLLLFHDQGHDTWAGRVKEIFVKYNITDENLEHTTSSELDIILRKFHEVRCEQYQRKLISDIKDDNKKITVYKFIKNDYRIEPHLIYLNNKKHQCALTRSRVSSHTLNIELGRYSRPPIPRANRLSNFCNSKEVDDEIHFLTKCEFHSEARYHLFDEIQRHQHISHNLSPEKLYQWVMTSKSEKVLAAIAKFTYFGFKRRDNFTEGWYLIYPIQILIMKILIYFSISHNWVMENYSENVNKPVLLLQ